MVVECILFDGIRELCRDAGIAVGERIRCRSNDGPQLLLETAEGRLVSLDQRWARFVQVAPCVSGSAPRFEESAMTAW